MGGGSQFEDIRNAIESKLGAYIDLDELNRKLSFGCLVSAEDQYNIPRLYIAAGVGSLVFSILLAIFGCAAMTNLIGFAYPLYATLKVISINDREEYTQWLVYWILYGFFAVSESFVQDIGEIIPLYQFVKLGLLVAAFLPSVQGAQRFHSAVLGPALERCDCFSCDHVEQCKYKGRDEDEDVAAPQSYVAAPQSYPSAPPSASASFSAIPPSTSFNESPSHSPSNSGIPEAPVF